MLGWDRKIRLENHRLASRGLLNDDEVIVRDRFFYPIHTWIMYSFSCSPLNTSLYIEKHMKTISRKSWIGWDVTWWHHFNIKRHHLSTFGRRVVDVGLVFLSFPTWENLSLVVCKQQRCRPACASAQSDQRLCYSLIWKYHIYTCYERNFHFPASLCNWAGWFESHFFGAPQDRFSRDETHMMSHLGVI